MKVFAYGVVFQSPKKELHNGTPKRAVGPRDAAESGAPGREKGEAGAAGPAPEVASRKPLESRKSSESRRASTKKPSRQSDRVRDLADRYGLTEEQVVDFEDVFRFFDKDNDGSICAKELLKVMRQLGQSEDEAAVDPNKTIDLDEFLKTMASRMKDTDVEEHLKDAFGVFDRDKNSFISADELHQVMVSLGEKITKEELQLMIREADMDNNGVVDYREFVKMMTSGK